MSVATFTTSMGTFKAELYTDKMPITWYVNMTIEDDFSLDVGGNDFGSSAYFDKKEDTWIFVSTRGHFISFPKCYIWSSSVSYSLWFLSMFPKRSGNFIDLANSGFYDGIVSGPKCARATHVWFISVPLGMVVAKWRSFLSFLFFYFNGLPRYYSTFIVSFPTSWINSVRSAIKRRKTVKNNVLSHVT